jgi:hypothetical protein
VYVITPVIVVAEPFTPVVDPDQDPPLPPDPIEIDAVDPAVTL